MFEVVKVGFQVLRIQMDDTACLSFEGRAMISVQESQLCQPTVTLSGIWNFAWAAYFFGCFEVFNTNVFRESQMEHTVD